MAKGVRVGDLILIDHSGERLALVTGGYQMTQRTWKFQITAPPGVPTARLPQSIPSGSVLRRWSPRK